MNIALDHPHLEMLSRNFDAHPAGEAEQARSAITKVLQERRGVAGSKLTGDGYPLELSFATGPGHTRWTADPWEPSQHQQPIAAAIGACERLGLGTERMGALSDKGFGSEFAWIGARHGSQDRFKLYLSCPADDDPAGLIGAALGQPCPAPAIPADIRMLAIDPMGPGAEVYWRARLIPEQIPALLAPADFAPSGGEVVTQIEEMWGHRIRRRMPGGSLGASFTIGEGSVFATIYLFARALWGSDASIRERWLARPDLDPGQRQAYSFATEGLSERRSCLTRHAMVGLHFRQAGLALSLGVRPELAA